MGHALLHTPGMPERDLKSHSVWLSEKKQSCHDGESLLRQYCRISALKGLMLHESKRAGDRVGDSLPARDEIAPSYPTNPAQEYFNRYTYYCVYTCRYAHSNIGVTKLLVR